MSFPNIGSRIRLYRRMRGTTQERLAEHLAITPQHLGQIERGKNAPSLDLLHKIAVALSVPTVNFFLDTDHDAGGTLDTAPDSTVSPLAMCGTWTVNLTSGKNSWSESLCRLLGHASVRTHSLKSFLAHLHDNDAQAFTAFHEQLTSPSPPPPLTIRVRRRDGIRRVLQVIADIVRHADGPGELAFMTFLDITDSRALLDTLLHDQRDLENIIRTKTRDLTHAVQEANTELELRMQAQALAERTSEDMRILLDTIPTQVWYLTGEHAYGAVNRAHAAFAGADPGDWAFRDMYEFLPADVVEACRDSNRQVFETARPVHCEEWVPHVTGERRLLSIRKTPKIREDGTVEYIVCSAEDITERKTAEEALRESEANFRTFFDTMEDMVIVGTPGGRVLHINTAVAEKLGYTLEEIDRSGILSLHPPDRLEEAEAIFAAMFRGERRTCPLPLQKKDGNLLPVETRVAFGRWNGQDCIFGVIKDLSAEQEARQRFERLFRSNPVPIALSTIPDRQFVDVNEAFLAVLGFDRSEVIGRTSDELGLFLRPEQQDEIAARLVRDGRIANQELLVRTRDGAVLTGLFSGDIIRNQDKLYYLTTMLDITDRKNMERALRRARDEAEEASRTKSSFLANMSHEIRTPVNGVMGMLQLLQETSLNGEQRSYAAMAMHSCADLTRLLSDILDLSRIEAGMLAIHPGPMNFPAIFENVISDLPGLTAESGVDFETRLDPSLSEGLWGDAMRIKQILANLAGNALKFTPYGKIVLEAWRLPIAPPGRVGVYFAVEDTGIGIPDHALENLFDPFSQVSKSDAALNRGVGLGLSICRKLVNLMGGCMSVVSERGVGTTFAFALNLSTESPEFRNVTSDRPGASARLAGKRILLAEDDPVGALAVMTVLRRNGAVATHVDNGPDVIAALSRESYDLAVLDVEMPGLSGLETTRRIRGGESGGESARIPIIALTAKSMTGDREECLAAGMDGYVTKPIIFREFLEVLAGFL